MGDMVVPDLLSEPLPILSTRESPSQDVLDPSNEIQEAETCGTEEQKSHSGTNEVSNGVGHDSSLSRSADAREEEIHNGIDIKEVDSQSVQGSSNKAVEGKGGVGVYRQDGVQELLQLAQEFESDEPAKRNAEDQLTDYREDPLKEKLPKENGVARSDEQHKLTIKDNQLRSVQKADTKSQKLAAPVLKKGGHLATQVQKPRFSSSSAVFARSEPKVGGKEADGISKRKKTSGDEVHLQTTETTALPQSSVFKRSASIGPSRSNFTVPQPFALATDKRASIGGRMADGEAGYQAQKLHRLNGAFGNSNAKISQVASKMGTRPFIVKSLHSESMKHLEESLMKPGKPLELKHDDEDSQSVSSIQSGSTTSKARLMGANGFYSKCEERAEKRKEFYSKLEEKYKSKEEEKTQLQAKTKEEMETEIRQLRKSLTFKATPMPTFYQEGIPPKVELKKIPTTRAKSPRLGRRNSCVGLESEGLPSRSHRSNRCEQDNNSTGNETKLNGENGEKISSKINTAADSKKPIRRSLSKLSTEKFSKSKLCESIDIPKHDAKTSPDMDTCSVNGHADSVKKRVNSASGNFSPCASVKKKAEADQGVSNDSETNSCLEREGDHPCQTTESEVDAMSESVACFTEGEKVKDKDLTETDLLKCESTRSKSLAADSRIVSKVKPGRVPEQVLSADNQDVNDKATKAIKRERLKASTPSFRNLKRDSIGNGSIKRTVKSGHDMTPSVTDLVVQ